MTLSIVDVLNAQKTDTHTPRNEKENKRKKVNQRILAFNICSAQAPLIQYKSINIERECDKGRFGSGYIIFSIAANKGVVSDKFIFLIFS